MAQFRSIEADLHALASQSTLASLHREGTAQKPPKKTLGEKLKVIFSNITVEPILLCYTFPNILASLAMQNLNLDKACRVNLDMNASICDALMARDQSGYTEVDEQQVQRLVSSMNTYKNVMQSLLPSIVLLLVGSWSDRHKRRKPCILMCLVGDATSCAMFLVSTYFFYELPLEYNIVAEALPQGIMGGWFVMGMAVYSYVSGVTSIEDRTIRIGAVQIFWGLSQTLGMGVSGVLYQKIGYYGIFAGAIGLYMVAILYTCLNIKEEVDNSGNSLFSDLFELKHVKDTLSIVFKKGTGNRRTRIILLIILVMIIIGPMHGEFNVMYMFLRYRFGWNEIQFSVFQALIFFVNILGNVSYLLLFSKYFKLDDAFMGMLSSLSKVASALVFGFAPTPSIFYIGVIVESLYGVSFIALRSVMSKLVPADEIGKLNSVFGVSEAMMPLVYGPLYNTVYYQTIHFFPGAFFILGGLLTTPSIFIFLWLYKEHKKDARQNAQEKEQSESFIKNAVYNDTSPKKVDEAPMVE